MVFTLIYKLMFFQHDYTSSLSNNLNTYNSLLPLPLNLMTHDTVDRRTVNPKSSTPIHNKSNVPVQFNTASPIMYHSENNSSNGSESSSTSIDSGFSTTLHDLHRSLNRQTIEKCTISMAQTSIREQSKKTQPEVKRRRIRRVIKLNEVAIRIMTSWYQRNNEHPYPSHETAEILAKSGNITVEQVQKWFSNRRMRDRNTKPLRIIAARRKRLIIDDSTSVTVKRLCQ